MLLTCAHVVLPDRLAAGWVHIEGYRITAVGEGAPPDDPNRVDIGDGYLLPGLVDMHCHGGGGAAFTSGDEHEARSVAGFHLRHGTTTLLASLVTAPVADLTARAAMLARLAADDVLAGVHFEGPFLSAARCGAQNPAHLRDPDPAALDAMVEAAGGYARMVTIAPERHGGIHLVRRAVDAGLVAAVGHTDATYDQAAAAIDAGATVATHLFNGMRGLHHREPGPVLACLATPEVICELINDGVHLHNRIVGFGMASGHAALVTDAMSAAGFGDGAYTLGGLAVRVDDGVARLVEGDTIAGSTLTMDHAVRRAIREVGVSWPEAVRAASLTPAAAIGVGDQVGSLEAGKRADALVLDADLSVRAVLARGEWVDRRAP